MDLSHALKDGNKASFGRLAAMPFLLSALCLQTAEGIMMLRRGESVIDAVVTLAMIGMALFTGSKVLSMRGTKTSMLLGDSTALPEAGPPPEGPPPHDAA